MNCQGQDELVTLYAIGALDDAERDGLRAHLASGCPRCAGLLANAQATWSLVGLSALEAGVKVPPTAWATLGVRIDGAADGIGLSERDGLRLPGAPDPFRIGPDGQLGRTASARRTAGWGRVLLAACLGIALTAGVAYLTLGTELARIKTQNEGLLAEVSAVRGAQRMAEDELRDTAAARDALAAELTEAQDRLQQLSTQLAKLLDERERNAELITALRTDLVATQRVAEMLYSRQLLTLDLAGQENNPEARARLLVDLQNKVWRLYASDLKPLDGRVYEFWLITADGTKVPMGSFTVDSDGKGTLAGTVPDPLPALAAAAVSDEPGPGATQPTGTLHVVGQFK